MGNTVVEGGVMGRENAKLLANRMRRVMGIVFSEVL